MKAIVVLVILVGYAWCYTAPTFQQGFDVGPVFAANHVLMTNDKVGRTLDVKVTFDKEFQSIPQVAITGSLWDVELATPTGFSLQLLGVTKSGFIVRVQATSAKKVYGCRFNWFATNDPRLHIQYVELNPPDQLNDPKAANFLEMKIPPVDWVGRTKGDVKVATFLIGYKISQGNPVSLLVQTQGFSNNVAKVSLTAGENNVVDLIRLCLVFSSYEKFFTSKNIGEKVGPDHAWHKGAAGERLVDALVPLPANLVAGERAAVGGFTGFDVQMETKNMRLVLSKIVLDAKNAAAKYGIWHDSEANQIQFSFFIYQADDYKVFSQTCAELFSECQFKGETIQICDNVNDLKKSNFKGSVKSVWVPKGKAVKLFNRADLNGKEMLITESSECLPELKFGFIEIQ